MRTAHAEQHVGDEPRYVGEDADHAAREGPGGVIRGGAQQGHCGHHEAHRQEAPHHQRGGMTA